VPRTQLQEIQKNRNALSTRLDSAKFDRAMSEIKAPVIFGIVKVLGADKEPAPTRKRATFTSHR